MQHYHALKILSERMNFSPKNNQRLSQLKKGLIGEKRFLKKLRKFSPHIKRPLSNLMLQADGSVFQIDFLIPTPNTLYMYEIKNYSGDYIVQDSRWFLIRNRQEIRNPLLQLERSHFLFRKLIEQYSTPIQVQSHLVFVNPTFMLYQAPFNSSLIFPGQIQQHLENLNQQINPTIDQKQIYQLTQWLLNQKVERQFSNLPSYDFVSLKKGVFCKRCKRTMKRINQKQLQCSHCEHVEEIDAVIIRCVNEIKILFPKMKITTRLVFEWTGQTISRKTILRLLKKNFKLINKGRHSYFEID